MTAPVAASQRFTRARPCPVCGGYPTLPQGRGERCWGFLSADGLWAYCTRPEYAQGIEPNAAGTYAHRLTGDCRCGREHGPAPSVSTNGVKVGKVYPSVRPATAQPLPYRDSGMSRKPVARSVAQGVAVAQPSGLTLEALAEAKRLPVDFLRSLGCTAQRLSAGPAVAIPYRGGGGNVAGLRYRLALEGARFRWRGGDHVMPYGLERLSDAKAAGWVLLVEGESDCWTAWHHKLPALGIPGKTTWRDEWAEHLQGLEVVVWQEPDAADLVERIARTLPDARVIVAPPGLKDISEAQIAGQDVRALVARLRANAPTVRDLLKQRADARLQEAYATATPIIEAGDPLPLVEDGIRARGYGGDLNAALMVYLCATTRVLTQRSGSMPAHVLLLGPPSIGKSYTWHVVRDLLPPEAYHEIDAGSPRVLIYDDADLRHRVIVFAEADSLPTGEDNPAASAIRALLQDGELRYKVTVRNPETGDSMVRTIEKPGPTVLVTTAVRPLGPQLMSRVFTISVPDDHKQVSAGLAAQAALELEGGAPRPDAALVALQGLLQAMAPIGVVVPFAPAIAEHLGRQPVGPRVMRDFARLIALVKAVAALRFHLRQRDERGRIVAEVDDYAYVYELLRETYEEAAGGAGQGVRDAVGAVCALLAERPGEPVRVTRVAARLGVHKSTAKHRVDAALGGGWLTNIVRERHPADLKLGDPLPATAGLPTPEELAGGATATEGATTDATADEGLRRYENGPSEGSGCAVAPLTGGDLSARPTCLDCGAPVEERGELCEPCYQDSLVRAGVDDRRPIISKAPR